MIIIFNKNQEYDATWCDHIVNVMRPNILGNPFAINRFNTRMMVIKSYREWLTAKMLEDSPQKALILKLRELHQEGKNIALICCCVPLDCHANVIKEFIEFI